MIRKDRRNVDTGAQLAREHGGGDGAVAVDEVERIIHERLHGLLREREARVIADELRHVDARIAHDREREAAVVRAGIGRRHNDGSAAAFGDRAAIVDDRVRNAVRHRRKRIVDKADGSVGHGCLLYVIKRSC